MCMIKIREAFHNKKAFIAYLMAGDPDLAVSAQYILTAQEAGAALVEVGIPFSDPIAEGPVIQAASQRALAAGTTTDKLFEMVTRVRRSVSIPLLFMTYLNPIYVYGKERFLMTCRESGIDGIIVPDMPFEEKGELSEDCTKFGIDLISMIAPTSDERIAMIAKEAEGFLYCVSSLGVTGMRSEINAGIGQVVARAKQFTDIPCAIGFGISNPVQAKNMAQIADGVIVGSAIVKMIGEYGTDCIEPVKQFVKTLKEAV